MERSTPHKGLVQHKRGALAKLHLPLFPLDSVGTLDITRDMTRQYKGMQEELLNRINQLEGTIQVITANKNAVRDDVREVRAYRFRPHRTRKTMHHSSNRHVLSSCRRFYFVCAKSGFSLGNTPSIPLSVWVCLRSANTVDAKGSIRLALRVQPSAVSQRVIGGGKNISYKRIFSGFAA